MGTVWSPKATWKTARSGSPEAYAPRLGRNGTFKDKKVLFQVAYGDGTVPNPTSAEILRAGGLYEKAWVYRNDRTPNAANNPHGFLLDPRFAPATQQGQAQVAAFLGDGEVVDPDGPGPVWEVPISDPALLLPLNYPSPATRP